MEKNYPGTPKTMYPRAVYKEEMLPALHNEHFFKERFLIPVASALERYYWWVIGLRSRATIT
jgi:hypothetical protein